MEQRDGNINHHGFIAQALIIFGITVIVIMGIGLVMGEQEAGYSTLFRPGMPGIAYGTLFEFLLSSVCLSAIERLFYSERYFKKLSYLMRMILMLTCIVVLMILFIIYFGWFPAYDWWGWLAFIISFGICFGVSMAMMVIKTKRESRLYEKRLAEYNKKYKEENSNRSEAEEKQI